MKANLIVLSGTFLFVLTACEKNNSMSPENFNIDIASARNGGGGSTVNLKSGLIAFWPFNGNANEAGGRFNGTVYGASLTADRFGSKRKAYSFDGIDDYIFASTIDQSYFDGKNYSISVWTNFDNHNNDYPYILWGGNGGFIRLSGVGKFNPYAPEIVGFYTMEENGTSNPTQNGNVGTYDKVSAQQWHNIVITKNVATNEVKIYVDGSLSNTAPYYPMGLKLITGSGLFFGKSTELINLTLHFAGKIDDIRIYNRVINSEEITFLSKN